MWINYTGVAVASYLLGSVPFGFLLVKWRKGIDIRTVGSGNIGATNVNRVLGRNWGLFCFALDFLKGFIAVLFLPCLFFDSGSELSGVQLTATLAVVAGHNWTCFLRFKGGKGVATGAGALFGMAPLVVLSCLAVWVVFIIPFRMVSLSSIIASLALPLFFWLFKEPWYLVLLGGLLAALSLIRHRANIKRILNGTESKIGTRINR